MAAAYNGASLPLVAGLLALGADMNADDGNRRKAAHWAVEGHHDQIATFLTNIEIIPVLCQAYISRLGAKSPLKKFPKDLMRLLRNALCFSNKPKPVNTPARLELSLQ